MHPIFKLWRSFVRFHSRILVTLVLGPLLAVIVAGAAVAARDHDIVPEDYFDLVSLGNLAASPDGSLLAYTESRWGQGKEGRSMDLWVVARKGGKRTRLTFGGFGGAGAVWSADGQFIYFLGQDRAGQDKPPHDGSRQVWRITPLGQGPTAVTRVPDGVGSFCLSPDNHALYYTTTEESDEDDWSGLRKRFPDLEYGHGTRTTTAVHRLDLDSWRTETVHPASRYIWDMKLSPDGKRLAMITTVDRPLINREGWSRVDVLDLATSRIDSVTSRQWRRDHPSPYGWLEDLAWAPDGKALAFVISYDGYASRIWTAERADRSWSLHEVTRPGKVSYAGGLKWRGQGRTLCYLGEQMARIRVLAVEKVTSGTQGKTRVLTPGDWVAAGFAFDRRGRSTAVIAETTNRMNDIYTVSGSGKMEPITDVNPQVATWKLPQISHVAWAGADGDTCWGILELPPGYKAADGPLPAVIELHGGPTSSTKYRLRLWIYGRSVMAARGYALLSPNYHGSTGYGDEFLAKLIGRENEIEVADITAGTRWLIDQGYADPARIGVMGWSNGGYLTNCMIAAQPELYAAASSGAGVLDMVIQWGAEDTPGHVINFNQGLPWQQPEHYRAASPLFGLDKVRTPTLIHVGGDDPRVPPTNSRALYRALHRYLNVPCQLVVYPGEPHGLTTHENRLAKIKWDLAWFDRYLLGKDKAAEAE